MNEKKVSIIVPIYNAEDTLEKCLKSLINQTYKNCEILLVDDGSTDTSGNICKKYAQEYDNIIYLYQENKGVSAARNKGIAYSTGEYLVFIDSDDCAKNNYCSVLVNAIETENADIAIAGFEYDIAGKYIRNVIPDEDGLVEVSADEKIKALFEKSIIHKPFSKIFIKDKIRHYFDESISFGEDLDFVLKYIKYAHKLILVNKAIYIYTASYKESLSNIYRDDGYEVIKRIYKFSNEFATNEKLDETLEYINYSYVNSAVSFIETVLRKEGLSYKDRKRIIKKIVKDPLFIEKVKNYQGKIKIKNILFLIRHKLYWLLFLDTNIRKVVKNKIILR